jgi:7-keto-8-aminopelargonate synthetase-like enzyme
MSSGFLAGQLIAQWIKRLFSKGYAISYAPHTHPAVFCGLEKIDSHDFESWVEQVVLQSYLSPKGMVLVCNAVDVLHAKVHNFEWIKRLNTAKEIILVVDDSHGIGITGLSGKGIYAQIPHRENVTKVVIASMGKALGMPTGMILGNQAIIEALKKDSFYTGASPALPAYCYAFLKIWEEYQKQLVILKKNIRFFSTAIKDLNLFDCAEDYPVFRTYQSALYPFLLKNQVLISSFPYPKPDSEPINRVVLSSLHTLSDLAYLVELLKLFMVDTCQR